MSNGAVTICLDIETVGDYLKENAVGAIDGLPVIKRAAAIAEMAAGTERDPETYAALSPALARVAAVGMLQIETRREHCAFDAELLRLEVPPPEPTHVPLAGERALLEHVNRLLGKATRLVTFNGRCFDLAVLVHRMVARDVTPSSTLLKAWREYRYRPSVHHDVRDLLTNFGAVNGPGTSLRAFAIGYGMPDPKANGDGAGVAELVRKGDAAGLCEYCLTDVRTTSRLYQQFVAACGVAS